MAQRRYRIFIRNIIRGGAIGVVLLLVQSAHADARQERGSLGHLPSINRAVVDYALGLQGTPYRYGGDSPATGFDCSGFVAYVYRALGVRLPHSAAAMAAVARPVPVSRMRLGDLLFFDTRGAPYSHVGLYVGDGRFIHAPTSGGDVTLSSLRQPYWARRFEGAREIDGARACCSPPRSPARGRWHTIAPGETLSQIAFRYHVTVTRLRWVNRLRGTAIRAGGRLFIPGTGHVRAERDLHARPKQPIRAHERIHIVRRGDTLWGIARAAGISVARLARGNGLVAGIDIRPGQALVLVGR
ncbi:MAG: hypothetical protein B7Z66_15855 [Chromatiales bacterium 21-64-14]|nr:MAG: hypothetical protein B7Z66_15855 [Chromatiales bacterium 21-64-14]